MKATSSSLSSAATAGAAPPRVRSFAISPRRAAAPQRHLPLCARATPIFPRRAPAPQRSPRGAQLRHSDTFLCVRAQRRSPRGALLRHSDTVRARVALTTPAPRTAAIHPHPFEQLGADFVQVALLDRTAVLAELNTRHAKALSVIGEIGRIALLTEMYTAKTSTAKASPVQNRQREDCRAQSCVDDFESLVEALKAAIALVGTV